MPQRLVCLLFAASLPLCFPSPACPANTSDNLPIKRVVLYKNGVGYFEHLGKVHDNQQVAISFTSGQLNDVLKSLTVLDLNGGRITGVAYGSSAPTDRQLDDLHIPTDDKTSLADFLGALRGARLEVRNGTTVITGRLLSVERKTRVAGGTTLEVDYVSLIGDTGELHTTEISPAFPSACWTTTSQAKWSAFSTWCPRPASPTFARWWCPPRAPRWCCHRPTAAHCVKRKGARFLRRHTGEELRRP